MPMPQAKPVKVSGFLDPKFHRKLSIIAVEHNSTIRAMIPAALELLLEDKRALARLANSDKRRTTNGS